MIAANFTLPDDLPVAVNEFGRHWAKIMQEFPAIYRPEDWTVYVQKAEKNWNRIQGHLDLPEGYSEATLAKARDPKAFEAVTTKNKGGLVLWGDTGSGKTSAAYARLINYVLLRGAEIYTHVSSVYLSRLVRESAHRSRVFGKIMRCLLQEPDDSDADATARWYATDGLLLDDIHVPKLTPAYAASLYELVEHWTSADNCELVVTSQLDAPALLAKWKADSPELADTAKAIVRRIADHCEPIHFVWEGSPWD